MDLLFNDFNNSDFKKLVFEHLKDLLSLNEDDDMDVFFMNLWEEKIEKKGEKIEKNLSLSMDTYYCKKQELNPGETIYIFYFPIAGTKNSIYYSALYLKKNDDTLDQKYFKFEIKDEDENMAQLSELKYIPSEDNNKTGTTSYILYDEKYEPTIEQFLSAISNNI